MAQPGKICITIDKEIWKKLVKLKLDLDVRTFDQVLDSMLIEPTKEVQDNGTGQPIRNSDDGFSANESGYSESSNGNGNGDTKSME